MAKKNKQEKEDIAQVFKTFLDKRVDAIRPSIHIDETKQRRGYRFKNNDFIYEKILEVVQDYRVDRNAPFPSANQMPLVPQSIMAGEYDEIIINMLHACSVADFDSEKSGDLH